MPDHDPARFAACFEEVARTRMAGLPFVNPALRVEAVGFVPAAPFDDEDPGWLGVLVTPWCMNLIWWPDHTQAAAAVGEMRWRTLGAERYLFIGAHEAGLDSFEICSLFSPMQDFADAATARAVAEQAMAQVLQALAQARAEAAARQVEAPARRAFLTGRLPAR